MLTMNRRSSDNPYGYIETVYFRALFTAQYGSSFERRGVEYDRYVVVTTRTPDGSYARQTPRFRICVSAFHQDRPRWRSSGASSDRRNATSTATRRNGPRWIGPASLWHLPTRR